MLNRAGKFKVDNEYYTPRSAWEQISQFIPKDKVVWEPFGYGKKHIGSPQFLRDLGCKQVVSTNENFFRVDYGDVIITNPPFDQQSLEPILKRLVHLEKPFILILPTMKLQTKYLQSALDPKHIQLILPRRTINFYQFVDGERHCRQCAFDTLYLCYKMNLEHTVNFL